MPRWFLSYHSPDEKLAERLKAAIERKDPASSVFFAPSSLRAGGAWTAQLAEELAEADAFILLIGEAGVGKWQVPEYDEALDRWVKSEPTVPAHRRPARRADRARPAVPAPVALDRHARSGVREGHRAHFRRGVRRRRAPAELWRYASPYRGLEAMEEKDSDYFFGRTRETVEALERARRARPAAGPDRQFGRRQILAGAGRRSGGAQASGLAGQRARPSLAGGVPEQPAMVLSVAEARRRADQGAGRLLPRRLAIRRDRSEAR